MSLWEKNTSLSLKTYVLGPLDAVFGPLEHVSEPFRYVLRPRVLRAYLGPSGPAAHVSSPQKTTGLQGEWYNRATRSEFESDDERLEHVNFEGSALGHFLKNSVNMGINQFSRHRFII